MPYSAGTIILHVTPSYEGFQDANRRVAKSLGQSLEDSLDAGAERGAKKAAAKISKVLNEETSKGADKAGEESADKYAGAFRTKLKSTIAAMQREIKPIKLGVDNEHLAADVAKAQAILKELSKRNTIKMGADTTDIRDKVAEAAALIAGVNKNAATIEIKGDTDPAIRAAKTFEKYVEALNPTVEIKVDTATAERQLGAFEKKLKDRLSKAMSAIGDSGSKELQQLQARLQAINLKKIGIDVSGEDAEREITKVERDLAHLVATTTNIQIHGDASDALRALETVSRAREKLDGKKANVKVDVDGAAPAAAKLSLLSKLMGKLTLDGRDTANSFRFFSFAALGVSSLGAALVPVLAAVAGGLLGISVAAIALGAGLGVLIAGFSGIGTAVTALNAAQDKAGKDTEANAKKMRNAAQSVADAERSLVRAREDASQRAQDADRAVVDAKESATRSIEQALRRQADAERNLIKANQDATKAQQDLIQARKDAQQELDDIAAKQKRNALDERQGVIDLFNATVENSATQKDGSATNLDKEQASINLANAKLRLEEIRKQDKALADQKKTGVAGSKQVKTAQDAVTAALEAQRSATVDLQDADKELVRTRLDGAKQVDDALRAQARSAKDSQQSIEDATRNLTRAQQDYQDALKETSDIGSASAQKVAAAMAGLSPAGQAFALFLHGLRDEWFGLRAAIQEGLLPGVQAALTTLIKTYGPQFTQFVGGMAKVLGDLFVQFADLMKTKDWRNFFGVIRDIAPIVTKDFGKAMLNWLTVFALVAQAAAPFALILSQAMVDLSQAVVDWMKSKKGQKAIQDFFAYIREVGPDVKNFLKALGLALLAVVQALGKFGDDILRALTSILTWLASLDPAQIAVVAASVLALVAAFQALSGFIALISVIASPVGLIVVAVLALVAAIVYLYLTHETARKVITAIWNALVQVFTWAYQLWQLQLKVEGDLIMWLAGVINNAWVKWIRPFFVGLGNIISNVWTKYLYPILSALGSLFATVFSSLWTVYTKVVWPVVKVLGQIFFNLWWVIMKPIFLAIGLAWKLLWDAVKWTFDKVIKPTFNALMKALGLDDNIRENGGGIVGAFRTAIDIIKTVWNTLADIAKVPIKFIVNTVMNKGIIAPFNALGKVLPGLKHIDDIVLPPGFSSGGIADKTYGIRPGYMPGRDNQIIAVGGGEAILRPEASAVLGGGWVDAINKRAKNQGQQGVAQFLGGFKNGTGNVSGNGKRTNNNFGDWDRTTYHGKAMDFYTVRLLQAAERIAGHAFTVTQGSYSNKVAASFGTHSGGGVLDLAWIGKLADVVALRVSGFAAWHRDPSQGPWNDHIHAVAIGDPTESPQAVQQVSDYFSGGDGLGGKDDGPQVAKDKSLLGKLAGKIGGLAGWVTDAISNPVDWLKGKISGKLEELTKNWGDNSLTQALKAIPEAVITGMSKMISGGLDFIAGGPADTNGIKGMVQALAKSAFGWDGGQWNALEQLVQKESSWNPNAKNPTSTAFGLFQFLDGTWTGYGEKTADPRMQAQYGMQYIKERYGNPENALNFHNEHNWYSDGGTVPDNGTMMYDNGGYLPPGETRVINLTGKPEPVFTSKQFEGMKSGETRAGVHYEPHFNQSDLTASDVAQDLVFTLTRLDDGVLTP